MSHLPTCNGYESSQIDCELEMAFSPKVQYNLQRLKCCSVYPEHCSSSGAVAFILHFISRGNTSQFISLLLFYTIFFPLLIKTVKRSVVSAAAYAGFGGRFRLVFV